MLLRSAVQIEEERRERTRAELLEDLAHVQGVELGKEYIDPKNPGKKRKSDEPYYSLERFNRHRETRLAKAYPWRYTAKALRKQRIAEQDAQWEELRKVMGLA